MTSLKQAETDAVVFSLELTDPLSKTVIHRKESEVTAYKILTSNEDHSSAFTKGFIYQLRNGLSI